jgi:hypothetical protein
MDFYATCAPCLSCIIQPDSSSAHSLVLRLLQFFVSLFIEEEEAAVFTKDTTPAIITLSNLSRDQRAYRETVAFLESIPTTSAILQQHIGSEGWQWDFVS